jgi:murein tripeptide amidase MpaA
MPWRHLARALLLGAAAAALTTPIRAQNSAATLATVAEQSRYQRTGRYDEVERLCAAYARTWPDAVRCVEFGRTPEGRPMLALVASRAGALTPEDARKRDLPVMLMQGGIHAGEIDGKDAGFLALREMLAGTAAPAALKNGVVVFVPVFNVDGHERVGRWNRPNQRGPEEMGWRTTAQNVNLNRDYAKADAPEMQAMLRLLGQWTPVLYVDLHVTDGADFQHDVSNTLEPIYAGDPALHSTGRALLAELNKTIAAGGSLPLDFYPSLVSEDDPASGFAVGASPARFSTGYWPLRNRFALLVETHSWKDYPTRVRVTHRIIVALAEMLARQGARWQSLAREADRRAERIGGQPVAIDFETGAHATEIQFRGFAYTREPSAVSGRLVTRYDPSRPQIWRVPLRDTVTAKTTVTAPLAGYIVPAAHAGWVAEKLALHGIRADRIPRALDNAAFETFRATKVAFSAGPFENRTTATVEGQWQVERRPVPAGSLFVPIAQPNARLALALLEPQSPDSLLAWGFFNSAFESKEYMEAYVAEQVAAEMLKDPEVAREFARRLAEDAAFAGNPRARLDFFYRRHPSFDERLNLYPIYRAVVVP